MSVCFESDNEAAGNLYKATGFYQIFEIHTYVKKVP
jgi:ribosomal protein S18 acetylase RimI-like enzyme